LIWLQVLLGFGALVSGDMLMTAPDGSLLHLPLFLIKDSPFHDFFIPGMILFVFLGAYPMGIAYALWKRLDLTWLETINPFKGMHWSWTGSLLSALIVDVWLTVELIWVPIGFLHVVYFVWSGLILFFTLLPKTRTFYQQSKTEG
jgi:hypothetical protein